MMECNLQEKRDTVVNYVTHPNDLIDSGLKTIELSAEYNLLSDVVISLADETTGLSRFEATFDPKETMIKPLPPVLLTKF